MVDREGLKRSPGGLKELDWAIVTVIAAHPEGITASDIYRCIASATTKSDYRLQADAPKVAEWTAWLAKDGYVQASQGDGLRARLYTVSQAGARELQHRRDFYVDLSTLRN